MSDYVLVTSVDKKDATFRVLRPTWGGSGIFSYVWGCLQSIYTYPNDKYYFDMREFSPYYDETITHTKNVWEYYFKQPYIDHYPEDKDIIEVGMWMDAPTGFCNLSRVTPEKKKTYHEMIKKNIILLPHIQEKIDTFAAEHDMKNKKILGVHCRGDKAVFDCRFPNSKELYIKEIEEVEKDYEMIFVISDEQSYIDAIKERFGDKVLWYSEASRQSAINREEAITNVAHGYKLKDKYKAGEGAIVDAYLLGYSKFLICPYSNVSTFSHYLNLDMQYVDIDLKHGHTKLP